MQRIAIAVLGLILATLTAVSAHGYPVILEYEGDLPENVRSAIEERLPDEPDAESDLHARRQTRRAKTIAEGVLNAYGYFAPTIRRATPGEGDNARPKLIVDPGAQFVVSRLVIRYQGEASPRETDQQAARSAIALQPGQPAVAAEVIDQERQIGARLRELGYPYAGVVSRDVIGDKDAKTISVRYNVSSGPRVVLGEMRYPDGIRTKDRYLEKINPLERGQLFDPSEMALYNSRLSGTRLFDMSLARLSEAPAGTTPDGDQIRDVVVQLEERDRHTLTLGAGFDTSEGFGVTGQLIRRNLTNMGDLLVGDAVLAQRQQRLDVEWRRPNEQGYGTGVTYFASLLNENTDAFNQQVGKLGAGVEVISNPVFQYGYGADVRYIRQTGETVRRDFQVVSINGSARIDRSDSLLDPRKGWRAEARLKPVYSFSDGPDALYARGVVQGRLYVPFSAEGRYVLAARAKLGTLFGADVIDVPGEDRFFAGGGGSVRGYGYQAIGPFEERLVGTSTNDDGEVVQEFEDIPLGGASLAEAAIEGRARITDSIGAVVFLDAGNVSDEAYPTFDNLRLGLGAGVRYQTPAGPIRLDVATPLNPSSRDEAIQVYISIGQAF